MSYLVTFNPEVIYYSSPPVKTRIISCTVKKEKRGKRRGVGGAEIEKN